jgi:hypothetical protein
LRNDGDQVDGARLGHAQRRQEEKQMKKHVSVALVSMFAMALLAGGAHAQINSTPPALQGQPSFHLYSVPDVIAGGGLATFFGCTNTTSANIRVGIEVFDLAGGAARNDASATSLDFYPGGSWRFGTDAAFGIATQSQLGVIGLAVGSARILATKRSGIICNAFIADVNNAPPTSMVKLTVVKKMTQKGD